MFKKHGVSEDVVETGNVLDEIVEETKKKPFSIPVVKSEDDLTEYEKLAGEIDFSPGKLLERRFLDFLAENGIEVFDYIEVDKYLRNEAEKAKKKRWVWRPLREKDKPDFTWSGYILQGYLISYVQDSEGNGSYFNQPEWRPYSRIVPFNILKLVKLIEGEFGDSLKFFVSDYSSAHPDPFLMATAFDIDRIIFAMWDEPSFK